MKKIFSKFLIALLAAVVLVAGMWMAPPCVGGDCDVASAATPNGKSKVDVYLIAGQSNAVGSTKIAFGSGYSSTDYTNTLLKFPHVLYSGQAHPRSGASPRDPRSAGWIIDDFRPVEQGQGYTQNHIGPELGMGFYLENLYKDTDTDAAIIKMASGGTALLSHATEPDDPDGTYGDNAYNNYGSWYPESLWSVKDADGTEVDLWSRDYYFDRTGYCYRRFVDFMKNQYLKLKDMGYTTINFRALCWMQGESDAGNPSEYAKVFEVFVKDIRSQVSEMTGEDYSSLPFVTGEISETFGSYGSMATNLKFIKMQDSVPYALKNVYIVDTAAYPINGSAAILGSDSAHWSYEDMLNIGQDFGKVAYEAVAKPRWAYVTETGITSQYNPGGEKPNGVLSGLGNNVISAEGGTLNLKITTDMKYSIKYLQYKVGKDGQVVDLLPQVEQRLLSTGKRMYTVPATIEAGEDDVYFTVTYADAPSYEATITIDNNGKEWGNRIYSSSYDKNVYEGNDFRFTALPEDNGEVKKITVNGVQVEYENKNNDITISNILQYLGNETELNVVVTYGEIKTETPEDPNNPPLTPENPSAPSSGCAAQAGQVFALVCALCVAAFVFRKVGA